MKNSAKLGLVMLIVALGAFGVRTSGILDTHEIVEVPLSEVQPGSQVCVTVLDLRSKLEGSQESYFVRSDAITRQYLGEEYGTAMIHGHCMSVLTRDEDGRLNLSISLKRKFHNVYAISKNDLGRLTQIHNVDYH